MQTIGDLEAWATERLLGGRPDAALHAFTLLVRLQPGHLDARLRVADCLLALGHVQQAAQVYTALARHAAHAGHPLRAIVAIKILAALEPQLAGLVAGLAELYAVGAPRLGRAVRLSPGDRNAPLPPGLDLQRTADPARLAPEACRLASDTSAIAHYPAQLPPIPLFSELPASAFGSVLAALKLVRARGGDIVVRQGDRAQSFFVIARGAVDVVRDEPSGPRLLATLYDGALFGEMALLTASPRAASVVARQDCDLLEFDRDALRAASADPTTVATIARGLDKFARERLLANLMATSPLFQPFDREQRLELLARFSAHDVTAGTPLIREGQPGEGLFVLLSGEVQVSRESDAGRVELARLGPGDVFGEISLLHDGPTTATVTACTNATVLFLPRATFRRLVDAVPALRAWIEQLGDERMMDTRLSLASLAQRAEAHAHPLDEDDLVPL
ncbi:MAG: cyclic nucleotide-binding domain-containing protein [Myxococcota bacterium]|nr:cyclic nucleotide-binding domain-containing protein [Myxococcota bacterium]MDW8361006.1 cyclic nucleotide-binding domain-containing protein [Myxococcales bacterium]